MTPATDLDWTKVLRDLSDETPRLIAADWLEEHGDSHRAAMLRLSVELGRWGPEHPDCSWGATCDCPVHQATRAERAILARHTGDTATGERWDRCPCPARCRDGSITDGWGNVRRRSDGGLLPPCPTCGGSGNLLLSPTGRREGATGDIYVATRPLTWTYGVPLVRVRVDEIAREEWTGGTWDPMSDTYRGERLKIIPTPWLRALPLGYGIELEEMPMVRDDDHPPGYDPIWILFESEYPAWLWRMIPPGDDCVVRVFPSREAATAALTIALNRWRCDAVTKP